MADCSSLPSDLVRRIAECLLDTNDLDCYMDFRAVCHSWRSVTDDPSNSSAPRFCPRNWIIIDKDFETGSCLMVNTASGRVLRKDLPVLRRYYVVAVTTNDALFVLADSTRTQPFHRPHDPFHGGRALQHEAKVSQCKKKKTAVISYSVWPLKVASAKRALLTAFEMSQITEYDLFQRYDILESAGELFLVLKEQHRLKVFRINTDRIVLEPVESIGGRAFFLGRRGRYMSVDADKFPSIEANCIYYVKSTDGTHDIYKYDLEGEKEERVSEARHSLNPSTYTLPATIPPFTILKLLSSYTNNIQTSQLTRCARTQSVTRSGVRSEYAYEASDPGSCWCPNMIEVVDFQNYPRCPRNGAEVARPWVHEIAQQTMFFFQHSVVVSVHRSQGKAIYVRVVLLASHPLHCTDPQLVAGSSAGYQLPPLLSCVNAKKTITATTALCLCVNAILTPLPRGEDGSYQTPIFSHCSQI
ncbi:hypothetical protein VPH35_063827 [Triticum aestivum]